MPTRKQDPKSRPPKQDNSTEKAAGSSAVAQVPKPSAASAASKASKAAEESQPASVPQYQWESPGFRGENRKEPPYNGVGMNFTAKYDPTEDPKLEQLATITVDIKDYTVDPKGVGPAEPIVLTAMGGKRQISVSRDEKFTFSGTFGTLAMAGAPGQTLVLLTKGSYGLLNDRQDVKGGLFEIPDQVKAGASGESGDSGK